MAQRGNSRGQYVGNRASVGYGRNGGSYSRNGYGSSRGGSYGRNNYNHSRGGGSRRSSGGGMGKIILIVILIAIIGAIGYFGYTFISGKIAHHKAVKAALSEASDMVVQYDYDGAIELLKSVDGYEDSSKIMDTIDEYTQEESQLVTQDNSTITHIFYHSLVMFPDWTFHLDDQTAVDNYNTTMTTGTEFESVLQQMYDEGYVIVSLHDMYEIQTDADGNETCVSKEIKLPEGKKAFVLSFDDLSYYEYMEGDGFPTRLVIDEDGVPRCEMTMQDGTTDIGNYDYVPILEDFIAEHPDACYKGARGCIALTGYDGVLGYRTDEEYNTDEYKAEHPDFDYEQECANAKKVADAMKARGWEFASHSWGHQNYTDISLDKMKTDMGKWLKNVVPIVGETDVMIYAFGAEIPEYGDGNDKFDYLKSVGFDCFCGINCAVTSWVEYGDDYFRQARRNVDGYRMYQDLINPDLNRLADIIDVEATFDERRPTPVPDY